MTVCRSMWIACLGPILACGAGAAVITYFACGTIVPALLAGLSGVAGSSAILGLLTRSLRDADAALRNPDLRQGRAPDCGLLTPLVSEAASLLERAEKETQAATRSFRELEGVATVRNRKTKQLESALRVLDTPVLITDSRDQVQYANAAALQLLGLSPDGQEKPLGEGLDHPCIAALKALITETRLRSTATLQRTAEIELNGDDGETVAYRAKATNVFGENGQFLGLVTTLSDIRDERLAKTRHAEFVSAVSHEMKTPMASIKAFVEMLMDGDITDEDEQLELYGFIDAQIDRLTRMVNSILNLARIESGVIKIQREDCELNEQLQKALDVIRPVAEEKNIRVIPELSELYMPVHIDPELFGQAMINLLSNAVKYTPNGGEVRFRSRMDEDNAIIEVRDTGMGIPDGSLPHIFDRFYRVPENNKAAAGTGLGLSLVHYIITDVHGGSISVESKVDVGTCFSARVPVGHRNPTRRKTEPALCHV